MARWALERVRTDLALTDHADDLLQRVRDVLPLAPRKSDLAKLPSLNRLLGDALRRGIKAFAWISEERGLWGDRESYGAYRSGRPPERAPHKALSTYGTPTDEHITVDCLRILPKDGSIAALDAVHPVFRTFT